MSGPFSFEQPDPLRVEDGQPPSPSAENSRMPLAQRKTFIELQAEQKRNSLLLLPFLGLVYFLCITLLVLSVVFLFGLVGIDPENGGVALVNVLKFSAVLSIVVAVWHFFDARYFGAKKIIELLNAREPNLNDRYHKRLVNLVEEMAIASGLPKIACYIVRSPAVNSMALSGADDVPIIVVSEGMLAELSRDQLQGAVAHELAHLLHGDAFYVTLVCSLSNFFEKIKDASHPTDTMVKERTGMPLVWAAAALGEFIVRVFGTTISREREMLADAKAVELTRNPEAVAGAIYRASVKRSFLGSMPGCYSPLYIVAPESEQGANGEGFFDSLISSHPPLERRMKQLAELAHTSPQVLIDQVWKTDESREKGRTVDFVPPQLAQPLVPTRQEFAQPSDLVTRFEIPGAQGKTNLQLSAEEIVRLPLFSMNLFIRPVGDPNIIPARDVKEVRDAFKALRAHKPGGRTGDDHNCPSCKCALRAIDYEGVRIKSCPRCHGHLVARGDTMPILTRRDKRMPAHLIERTAEFQRNMMLNPMKHSEGRLFAGQFIPCPKCSAPMVQRPFSYQYFLPIDECYACELVWFDPEELEVLQVLVEAPPMFTRG